MQYGFRVVKELRNPSQLEYRYLVQGTYKGTWYVARSFKELEINSAVKAIRKESQGSKKYLLNKYK